MPLSEAIKAVSVLVSAYPNGGRDADRNYIGHLAAELMLHPREVAKDCCAPGGLVRECKFMPTPADIAMWCERKAAALHQEYENEERRIGQIRNRDRFIEEQTQERSKHLSVEELKEKHGDWNEGWKPPGTKARALREAAEAVLVKAIGREAFDRLPNKDGANAHHEKPLGDRKRLGGERDGTFSDFDGF